MTTDYGKGSILGAASMLPATSAASFFMYNHTHPAIIVAFVAVSIFSLIVVQSYLIRYLINKNK